MWRNGMIAVKEVAGVLGDITVFLLDKIRPDLAEHDLRDVMEMVIRYLRNRKVAD